MSEIKLKYGQGSIAFEYDEDRLDIVGAPVSHSALTDAGLNEKLDQPIASPVFEDLIAPGESVLIVVPDATRAVGSDQVVNLVVRRLIANGTAPHDIRIIFATGIHRKVSNAEKDRLLTPFITQRIKTLDHDPRDLMQLTRRGETADGIPIELNRALAEHDRVIIVGGVTFHYFAGFTGGRKLICPGLASARTISASHKLAFDCERLDRRMGVGTGLLDGNAVHEAFVDAASKSPPVFSINTIVNDRGEATDVFCGDWIAAHRAACDRYAERYTVRIEEKRELVVVSCGGYPYDLNMIQAHKALEAAARVCTPGGTIILLAECADGLGRDDFLTWFDAEDSFALAGQLCQKYRVNGQTAWSLLRKAEQFDLRIVTELDNEATEKMRLNRIEIRDLTSLIANRKGYVIPQGAKVHFAD